MKHILRCPLKYFVNVEVNLKKADEILRRHTFRVIFQNVANSYVRNYKCPGVYEVSKQIQLEDMDGGGYASLDEEAGKELQSSAKELQASDYQSIK